MKHDVVIVGAGHNGLTAAYYLARKGLDVHLVEARAIVGGACVTEELIPRNVASRKTKRLLIKASIWSAPLCVHGRRQLHRS